MTGILISLQISKSLAAWDVASIVITYPLPLVPLASFNNSLFVFIGWVTG